MGAKCKIRIIKEITDLLPQYQPKVGKIYDAEYREATQKCKPLPAICVIDMLGKKIMIRKGEYEIVGH